MYAVPKILVTGFKPFQGSDINPSEIHSRELSKMFTEVDSLILPVEFENSFEVLKARLSVQTYDHVIMLGLASGRKKISFEKIGLNWVQTEHPDESGVRPQTGYILQHKPLALMSVFPVDDVYLALKKEKLPVEISFSAGAFVCNDLYFRMLNEYKNQKAVFIHVPLIKDMDLNLQKSVLSRIIQIINARP